MAVLILKHQSACLRKYSVSWSISSTQKYIQWDLCIMSCNIFPSLSLSLWNRMRPRALVHWGASFFEDVPLAECMYLGFYMHAGWELLEATQVFVAVFVLHSSTSSADQLPCVLILYMVYWFFTTACFSSSSCEGLGCQSTASPAVMWSYY